MFFEIPDILSPEEVARLKALSTEVKFVDGRATNPHSQTKNNLQLDQADPRFQEISQICHAALVRHPDVRNFAFPKFIAPPLMTKYRPGMNYGQHSDAPFLQIGQRPIRSDLSCTLFLNDLETYDGGELSVQLGTKHIDFKMNPGGAILYPSTTIHQVRPVTRGERLTVITFMESRIVDQTCRELLFQLNEVKELESLKMSWENRTRIGYVSASLERMWGDAG